MTSCVRSVLGALFALIAVSVAAQDYIVTEDGPLSDKDFYALVACGAPPGGTCDMPFVRWPDAPLRVAFAPIPDGYPKILAAEVDRSLTTAIAEINDALPQLQLRRAPIGSAAEIEVFLLPIQQGELMIGTGRRELDATPIGAAHVQVWWNGRRELTEAVIVVAQDIQPRELRSIMLEELTQSLGFLTDIRNPHYETRSIFSEDSNSVVQLGNQDRMALRLHYRDAGN